ncbi:response regulator [Patescibacteria group bacterium]|nr:response regulator [Patescibacteria group bacterium]
MKKIMIVDDEPHVMRMNEKILKDKGFETVLCESGNEALLVLESGVVVDLVFIDLHMPDGNGIFLIKEVKKRFPNVPCILQTGALEIPENEADSVLKKPYYWHELIALVNKHAL